MVTDGHEPIQINIKKVKTAVQLDGVLDEDFWQNAQVLSNFSQYQPVDSISACGESQVMIAYDDENIYIAAKCFSTGDNFGVENLRRDYGFMTNDNITFLLDTYSDKTNSYMFGMNPYGARREALIANAGRTRDSFDPSWDNKWDGNAKRYDNYWICELAIPFKTIRYKEGTTQWRFNTYRNDRQCNEISTWINIPRQNILMDMTYMADLNFEQALEKPGKNISIIPYITGGLTRDFEDLNEEKSKSNFNIGGDAKISVSSSLNLDLTANPDFSQVEVDRQVTNLDRFEIFFPERRQFFLENADLFGRFGTQRVNPFFSRRIGVSQDTVTGNNIQNTIYGGARLSGKLNERLRIGLLNMVAAPQIENDLPTFNYTVAAVEQQIGQRSNLAFITVNKQALDTEGFGETVDRYDRVVGVEYRLGSVKNYWTGKFSYLRAVTPNAQSNKQSILSRIEYNRRRYRFELTSRMIGDGFDAEVGFVPRRDIFEVSPRVTLRWFPTNSTLGQFSIDLDTRWIYKLGDDDSAVIQDFGLEENNAILRFAFDFVNNNRLSFRADYSNITLLNDFDPTRIQSDEVFLSAGEKYKNFTFTGSFGTNRRNPFRININPRYARFFGGTLYGGSFETAYRIQPYGTVSLNVVYNHIELGGPFETANLWLIGPRFDITFSKKHFLTTFIQYNNQIDNLSINTRFQWRFAPASDFFIVYSDNYNTGIDNLSSRNRGIVAKLSYWLNL